MEEESKKGESENEGVEIQPDMFGSTDGRMEP